MQVPLTRLGERAVLAHFATPASKYFPSQRDILAVLQDMRAL